MFKHLGLFLSFWLVVVGASPSFAAWTGKPKCSKMTEAIWQKNQTGCMRAFKMGLDAKKIDQQSAQQICDCVADHLVNELSCEDMYKFDHDKKFEKEVSGNIVKACTEKVPLKKKSK
jgi:hypothetical protein